MGAKKGKKASAYVPEALETFAKDLARIRIPSKSVNVPKSQVIPEKIPEVLNALSKEDRESIERYWGLTGGVNHSKRMGRHNRKDQALFAMCKRAVEALKKMSNLELARIYDSSVDKMINLLISKINKDGITYISDFDSVKYLMVYFIVIENGPKLSLEHDPMIAETDIDEDHYIDEYEALKELCEQLEGEPDKFINLSLIKNLLEAIGFKNEITIRDNFGIKSPEIFSPDEIQMFKSLGVNISEITSTKVIQEIMTFGSIRAFKESVFKYGAWEVTGQIIQGNTEGLEDFIEELARIYKNRDWVSRIEEFKTGEKKEILISTGTITLDIYRICGLEFTDPCEIDFLRTNL